MKKQFKIRDSTQPLLVGMDHDDNSLGKEAEELIDNFGQKGKTLFVEGSPTRVAETGRTDVFGLVISKAREKGMKVVALDTERLGKLRQKIVAQQGKMCIVYLNVDEFRYLMSNVRERLWAKTIRKKAVAGDIVLAHQNHIARLARALPNCRKNVFFVSKPFSLKDLAPLSNREIVELKRERASWRPINMRAKKTARQSLWSRILGRIRRR
jgi:hypothetical protein